MIGKELRSIGKDEVQGRQPGSLLAACASQGVSIARMGRKVPPKFLGRVCSREFQSDLLSSTPMCAMLEWVEEHTIAHPAVSGSGWKIRRC